MLGMEPICQFIRNLRTGSTCGRDADLPWVVNGVFVDLCVVHARMLHAQTWHYGQELPMKRAHPCLKTKCTHKVK